MYFLDDGKSDPKRHLPLGLFRFACWLVWAVHQGRFDRVNGSYRNWWWRVRARFPLSDSLGVFVFAEMNHSSDNTEREK